MICMESGEITFEELCGIVAPIAREHGVKRVCLFGSRARGDSNKGSDFDFCIDVPKEATLMDVGGFYYDIKEALGTDDIDMVCEDEIEDRPHFLEEVLRDRRVVFEARH